MELPSTLSVDQYEAALCATQRQVEDLKLQLQDYNNACQCLENALIQEQIRSKQLLDDIDGYKAMLALKDQQLDELRGRLSMDTSPSRIPQLLVAEKEVFVPFDLPLQRTVSVSPYLSEKEVMPPQGLNVPSPLQNRGRAHSFSDKQSVGQSRASSAVTFGRNGIPEFSEKQLVMNMEKRQSRASSAITFDALGVPTHTAPRSRSAELKEPKGYSSRPNLRYLGEHLLRLITSDGKVVRTEWNFCID